MMVELTVMSGLGSSQDLMVLGMILVLRWFGMIFGVAYVDLCEL
jgi:hypothetical protein